MNKIKLSIIFVLILSTSQAMSWGQTGHRVTAQIAEHYLSYEAKTAIAQLLNNEDLAEISTYPDEMRSNPSEFWQETANPWHYVNVHAGKTYDEMEKPDEGDAVSALAYFSKQLKSDKSSLEDKQLALKFIVHIVADLHQPLHSGTDIDEGGNQIKVKFFWEDSNLHRVWDSELIDRQKLSYTEWSHKLQRKILHTNYHQWQEVDPKVWITESAKIRAGIYPKPEEELSWDYQYKHLPTIKKRLQMGGVRLAAYLNNLFADSCQC